MKSFLKTVKFVLIALMVIFAAEGCSKSNIETNSKESKAIENEFAANDAWYFRNFNKVVINGSVTGGEFKINDNIVVYTDDGGSFEDKIIKIYKTDDSTTKFPELTEAKEGDKVGFMLEKANKDFLKAGSATWNIKIKSKNSRIQK